MSTESAPAGQGGTSSRADRRDAHPLPANGRGGRLWSTRQSARAAGATPAPGQAWWRSKKTTARSLTDAVTEFGVTFPTMAPRVEEALQDDVQFPLVGRLTRGPFKRGYGWAVAPTAPVRVYRVTSDQVGGVFPFLTSRSLPKTNVLMGLNASTATGFYCDPVSWTLLGITSNSNILVLGKPGMGKSATVKALIRRAMRYGAKVLIAGDLKDEYVKLCDEFHVAQIEVGPGLPARINPLDPGPLGANWDTLVAQERTERFNSIRARWLTLLAALIGSQKVTVTSSVRAALAAALDECAGLRTGGDTDLAHLPAVTIPMVWEAMRDPSAHLVTECRYSDAQTMRDDLRLATDALGSLVKGALAGMFDAETTIDVDWDAPIQSMSLRRLKGLGNEVIAVAITCINSWSSAMTAVQRRGQIRYVVRDECWRQMRLGPDAVESLDADLRLSRDDGAVQVMVMHKPSDMGSVGDAGSREAKIAKDMWALCDTKILLAQERQIADEIQQELGLSAAEGAAISKWCWGAKGRALWRVGDTPYRVRTILTEKEQELFHTNTNLSAGDVADNAGPPTAGGAGSAA